MSYEVVTTTQRLVLREFEEADLKHLSALCADPEVMRFSVKGTRTEEESKVLLQLFRDSYHRHQIGKWAVFLKENLEFLGYCGLMLDNIEEQVCWELGFRLFPRFWNRGYATEAAAAAMDVAFQTGIREVYAFAEPANQASLRVIQKLGMQEKGRFQYDSVPMQLFHFVSDNRPEH